MRIVILTGAELRHDFFRKYMASSTHVEVLKTYCEGLENNLKSIVEKDTTETGLRLDHLKSREQSEKDFFEVFVDEKEDNSNPCFLQRGDINQTHNVNEIIDLKPDLIVAYGCSLVKGRLLEEFKGRFLNVHLGLSPYYRGSGTNFWPLVNAEPEFVGATFMYIDPGIDTGEIIHQIRARYFKTDSPAQVGNRLIVDMAKVYRKIVERFDDIANVKQPDPVDNDRLYRKKDYTEESVVRLYDNFANGLVERYLSSRELADKNAPLVLNPCITDG